MMHSAVAAARCRTWYHSTDQPRTCLIVTQAKPVAPQKSDTDDGAPFDGIDLSHAEVEIGISIFDIEHREMLRVLQELYGAIAASEPRVQVQRQLARLIDITNQHFAHEEQYMREFRYPDASRHLDDHNSLGVTLETFVAELYSDAATETQNLEKVRAYFKRWLLDHILEFDLALANFLVQRQIG